MRWGIDKGLRFWKLAFWVYLINLFWGTFIAAQFYTVFQSFRAGDWQHLGWGRDWDHLLIKDFLRLAADALSVLRWEVILLLPVFIAMNIFVTGGVLFCGEKNEGSWSTFWRGGSRFFGYIGFNFICYAILILLWTALVMGFGISRAFYHLSEVGSEIGSMYIILSALVIYTIGMLYFINASSVSKASIVSKTHQGIGAISFGLRMSGQRFIKLLIVFLAFLLGATVLLFIQDKAVQFIGYTSWFSLFIIIIVQQGFVLGRGILRMMYLYTIQNEVNHTEVS